MFYIPENSKYKSALKRKEYSNVWKKENEKKIVIKRLNNFNRLFYNIEMSQKPKKDFTSSTELVNKINKEGNKTNEFSYKLFFKEVDNLDMKDFNNYCENKYKIYRKHYALIKKLVLLIINVTMEGYIYQAETKKDLIDIPFYLKLIKLFINNKRIKRKIIIDEFKKIKEVSQINEVIDLNEIKLKKDELLFLKDYSYLIGFWNKSRIIETEIFNKKLDYKLLFYDKRNIEEYEPIEMENEDLTIPNKLISNYDFGDFITEFIEHKYSQMRKLSDDVNEDSNQISKWFYIQYKIVLVGQSFLGNKYLSQQFNKKYPYLKIYSVHKLLQEYCLEYKNLISEQEDIEINTKAKSKKKNQQELNKKQKEEKLIEFQPILEIIKPYLELEENNASMEKTDKKKENIIIPQDEVLLKLLIYQIEKDFPEKTKNELAKEIKENMNKINSILDKMEEIKDNLEEKAIEKTKEKEKKGSKKDKGEKNIESLEKELETIKLQSIKGFIIVDFPNNLNQCHLLENYLTGYVEETQRPKSLKSKEMEKISDIIDIKYQPKTEKKLKNAGIDFLIHLSSKENDVNKLFKNIKYDPKEDYIYSKMDLDTLTDKKLTERLTDKVPYYDISSGEYYKREYEENISKINLFYDKFGYYVDEIPKDANNPFISFGRKSLQTNNKVIKVFQAFIPADLTQRVSLNLNVDEVKKKKKLIKNLSIKSNKSAKSNKSNKEKKEKKEKESNNEKDKINNLSPAQIFEMATKNVVEFFSNRIEALM